MPDSEWSNETLDYKINKQFVKLSKDMIFEVITFIVFSDIYNFIFM